MDIASILGLIGVALVILMDIGHELHLLFDPQALVFVLAATLVLNLLSFTVGELRTAIATTVRWLFTTPADESARGDLETAVSVLQKTATYAQAAGWIGVFFGLLVMLDRGVFSDPGTWQSGLRVCILTAVYGTLIAYMVCVPASTKLSRRIQSLP